MLACFTLSGCSSGSSSNSSHLAYVATSSGIFAYRISDTGVPTTVFSAPFVLGRSPSSIVIAPSGLGYVADSLDNTISRVKIDTSSGALSEVLPRTTIAGSTPSFMVTDSSGGFLYVANQGSNDVESYSVGSDGSLTFASSASVASSPSGLVLSASDNLLFVSVPNFSSIYAFTVSSGALTPVAGSPFHVANGVASVARRSAERACEIAIWQYNIEEPSGECGGPNREVSVCGELCVNYDFDLRCEQHW